MSDEPKLEIDTEGAGGIISTTSGNSLAPSQPINILPGGEGSSSNPELAPECESVLGLTLFEEESAKYFMTLTAHKDGQKTHMRFSYRYPNFVWRFFAWLLLGVTYHKY